MRTQILIILLAIPLIGLGVWFLYYKDKNRFSKTKYGQIAQLQFNAMTIAGTNEELLFGSLRGLTNSELVMVYHEFGSQNYYLTGYAAFMGSRRSLFEWYIKELSKRRLAEMYNIWKNTGLPNVSLLSE